jgi:hypothetical protein
MSQDFNAAEERACLAAADLLAAASKVIARHSMRSKDVRDDVDAAVLSRRTTSYAPCWRLDDALDDVDVASRARAEIRSIAATLNASAPGPGENAVAAEAEIIGRPNVIADDCERRAVARRS